MGKKLVLLFSLLILLFLAVSSQQKTNKSPQRDQSTSNYIQLPAPEDTLLEWMTHMKNESQVYRDRGENAQAKEKLTECITGLWRSPSSLEEFEKLAWIYTNRAYLYNNMFGDFLSAKEDYLSALKCFDNCEPSEYLVARYVYQPLGNIFTRLGENEIAISMLEKFKQACEESDEKPALMSAYNDIGKAYLNMGQIELGIDWMSQGIALNPEDDFSLGLLYSSKAEAEVVLGDREHGLSSAKKCIQHVNAFLNSTDPSDFRYIMAQQYKISGLSAQAHIYAQEEKFNLAHQLFLKVDKLAEEVYPKGHRARARAISGLARSFNNLGEKEVSLRLYQQSLASMFDDLDSASSSVNPTKEELYADVVLGEVLYQKAMIAHDLFREKNEEKWLRVSVNAYQTYFDWVEIQRTEQFEFYSKLGAASEIHTIGESALEALFDMYAVTKKSSWVDTAFLLMDQTKAIVLAEERGFKDLAEKNPEIRKMLKKQNALKFQRSQFQSDLNGLGKIEPENMDESLRLKERISEIDEQSQLLDQDIRVLFPSYRKDATASVDDELLVKLRDKLKRKNASVLSYFVGGKSVFAITGSPAHFKFERFSRRDLVDRAVAFMEQLNAASSSTPEKYSEAGKSLFDLLIGKEAENLDSNWLVIPDGLLNGLPFEALVSSKLGHSFKTMNYLLRDHVMHYAPSAFFYAYERYRKEAEKPFLGIAPTFQSSDTYDYLPKSKQELELGVSLFSGEELTEEKATKEQFLKRAEEYDILHISTHAGTNSGTNNDAWMVFADDKSKNYKLEAYELLKLNLPASLVVLNACETGSGTIFKGEGPMSLARGFLNAGSESTITNLWSVNHESNAAIMRFFYESLSQTQSPSSSLCAAKLKYLSGGEIDDASAHPFYWSAPILIGSDVSVRIPNSSTSTKTWMLIGLASIATMIFVTVFFLKSRKRAI